MYYGHPRHVPSGEDLTILHCYCGWFSEELNNKQLGDRGIPWYCDRCGKQSLRFVTFHPRERQEARWAIGLDIRDEKVTDNTDNADNVIVETSERLIAGWIDPRAIWGTKV